MQQKEKIFSIIVFLIPAIVLATLCLYYIRDNQLIKICGDEFGYWAAGSWFAGYDWSEVQGINRYYGYGYGIILSFILRLTSNQTTAYQIALVLNAIMICIMYFMAVNILNILDNEKKLSNIMKVSIAVTSVLFSSNLYFTQFTMSETILTFCYWIIFYIFVLLLDKFTLPRMFAFYLFALASISIHLRTVGVLAICIIAGVLILCKHKVANKRILSIVIFLTLSSITVFLLKKAYQNSYISKVIAYSDANELTGQLGKIQFLFTKDGIKTFFEGVCGKLFYAINSTFLLSAIPIYVIFDSLKKCIKKCKKKERIAFRNIDLIITFLLTSTLLELLIDALYMIHYTNRFDLLTYGRYFEYTLTPLILIGIYVIIYYGKQIMRYILILNTFNLLLAIYTNQLQNYNIAKTHVHMNISSFYEEFNMCSFAENSLLAIGLKSVFILIIFALFIYFDKIQNHTKSIIVIGLMAISILWIKEAKFTYENGCLSWTMSFQEAEKALADNIVNTGIQDDLVYYNEGNYQRIMPLQFLLKESTIKVESDINIIEAKNYNYILSVSENKEGMGNLDETKYELIDQSKWLRLWKKR